MTDDSNKRNKRESQQRIVDELKELAQGLLPPILNGTWRLEWPEHFRPGVSFEELSLVHVLGTDRVAWEAHRVLATNVETGEVRLLKDREGVLRSGAASLEDILNECGGLPGRPSEMQPPGFWIPPSGVPGEISFHVFKSRDGSTDEKLEMGWDALDALMQLDEEHLGEMRGSGEEPENRSDRPSDEGEGRFVPGPRITFHLDEPGRPPEVEGDATGMIGMSRDDPRIQPDWDTACGQCGSKPVVPLSGMCGPCTFGERETEGGDW